MRHIALDTEATDRSWTVARPFELAMVEFDPHTGRSIRELSWNMNPGVPIPFEVESITGVSTALASTWPKASASVYREALDFAAGARIYIHNRNYDEQVFDKMTRHFGLHQISTVAARITCTLQAARQAGCDPANLNAVCDHFGIDRRFRKKHGALVDCRLLARVVSALFFPARSQAPQMALDLPAATEVAPTVLKHVSPAAYGRGAPIHFATKPTPQMTTPENRPPVMPRAPAVPAPSTRFAMRKQAALDQAKLQKMIDSGKINTFGALFEIVGYSKGKVVSSDSATMTIKTQDDEFSVSFEFVNPTFTAAKTARPNRKVRTSKEDISLIDHRHDEEDEPRIGSLSDWNVEEDQFLKSMIAAGANCSRIAQHLGRSLFAIVDRLASLEVVMFTPHGQDHVVLVDEMRSSRSCRSVIQSFMTDPIREGSVERPAQRGM